MFPTHLLPLGFLIGLLASLAEPARPELPQAVPVDSEPFRATPTAIDARWQVTFDTPEKPRVMPAGELVYWGTCAEAARGSLVLLADGGLLVAEVPAADNETLTADSELFGSVKLPLELVAGVVFDLPADCRRRDLLLARVAQAEGESDLVMLANGDKIDGSLSGLADGTIRLETDVGRIDIQTHRASALVFNPALVRRAQHRGLRAWVGLADGSRLIATRLVLQENSLAIALAAGAEWSTTAEKLVFLQPLGGRIAYLSDLKPAGYRHVSYLDLNWPYRTDRNLTGGQLRCGGRLALKGLAMHSSARLTYRLAEPYRRFQAELGIDDSTSGGGSVRFRVYVDGHLKYTSGVIRGGSPPLGVSVELPDAKRLDLIVDFADFADGLDHADWLNARLVR